MLARLGPDAVGRGSDCLRCPLASIGDHRLRYRDGAIRRHVEHDVQHHVLQDGASAGDSWMPLQITMA